MVFDHLWLAYDYRSEASGSQGLECWPVCVRGAVLVGWGGHPCFGRRKLVAHGSSPVRSDEGGCRGVEVAHGVGWWYMFITVIMCVSIQMLYL